jgi:hypothetical protein
LFGLWTNTFPVDWSGPGGIEGEISSFPSSIHMYRKGLEMVNGKKLVHFPLQSEKNIHVLGIGM